MLKNLALVDSVSTWADNAQSKAIQDWVSKGIGADAPTELIALRGDLITSVLDACGVPAELTGQQADGTAQRESFRRFATTTVMPLLNGAALEFAKKLDTPGLKIDLAGMYTHDLVGHGTELPEVGAGWFGRGAGPQNKRPDGGGLATSPSAYSEGRVAGPPRAIRRWSWPL